MKRLLVAGMFFATMLVPAFSLHAQSAREATIEAETKFKVTLQSQLSSKLSEVGDPVTATIDEPLLVNGEVVIARGTEIRGRVAEVKAAGRPHKEGKMSIIFERIAMPWGEEPITVVLTSVDDWNSDQKLKANDEGKVSGGKRGEKTVDNMVRGGQLGGATAGIILLSGGGGAASAGALGGGILGGVLLTKGSEVRLQPGAQFRLKFIKPLTLPVARPNGARPEGDEFDRPAVKKPDGKN
ncbi:MAG: hypothetical protein HY231_07170 [Acidobacteria bacterium]|nr:hypothetical protein [Acidobacteriota bacterium]